MDFKKQTEEMVGAWTNLQRQMWDNWLGMVKQATNQQSTGMSSDMQKRYMESLDAWEKSVREALEAQQDWAQRWSQQMQSQGQQPEGVAQVGEQIQEMMKGWTEAQAKLWDAWFESVRQMDPSQATQQWEKESRQVLEAWREAAERAQKTMEDFASSAQGGTGGTGGSAGKSGGSRKKSS